jgi:serine/threonine protein phosphatase PrpC
MTSDSGLNGSFGFRQEARSDMGRVRSRNEDCLIVAPDLGLFGVCDGMGGHAAGEVASSIAVQALQEELAATADFSSEALRQAIATADKRIFRDQDKCAQHRGMGTTLSALWLVPESSPRGWIGHVGDSRIYRHHQGGLQQLTVDHSPVFRLFQSGLLGKDEMQSHPYKHVLDRALGLQPPVDADVFPVEVEVGDVFLICTDGLTDVLIDQEIDEVLKSERLLAWIADQLVSRANQKGGIDNISLVLVEIV